MTQTDIDAVLDLAGPAAQATTEDAQSAAADSEAAESTATYPNVLRTYNVGDADGENTLTWGVAPEGTVSIGDFAGYLTVENFKANGYDINNIVRDQVIYTGVRARRYPLPVVLVFPEGVEPTEDNQSKAKVFLPIVEAEKAYRERPEREQGSASSGSKRTKDDLILGAAKKLKDRLAIQARYDRAAEQLSENGKSIDKYKGWLSVYFKDAENPADALNEAIASKVEELVAAEEAEKAAKAAENA